MPAVGDQHKSTGPATNNPFEDTKPHISEYTAQEIATLQSRLDKQLGPEYISSRPGAAGKKVHYLAAEKVINLANEVFGFNGWSSAIQNIQIDFVDEHPQTGKISLGLSVVVRVTLRDGTFHEDIGYGHIENCAGKAAAFEKAKKEGTTDGLKRALRTFGNVLGNCVYDKDYVAKVTKVKVGAGRWDPNALHRHPDFVQKKEEDIKPKMVPRRDDSFDNQLDETFDLADFDDAEFDEHELGNPDEVVLPADSNSSGHHKNISMPPEPSRPPLQHSVTTPARAAIPAALPTNGVVARPLPGQAAPGPARRPIQGDLHAGPAAPNRFTTNGPIPPTSEPHDSSSPGVPSQHFTNQASTNIPPQAAGFFSAKAAAVLDSNAAAAARFNLHAESPSIRRTAGVDHKASRPVARTAIPDVNVATVPPRDFVDPKTDQNRRVGVPAQPGQSPIASKVAGFSTSAYRPPTRRGPEGNGTLPPTTTNDATTSMALGGVDRVLMAAKRSPLTDVSNVAQQNVTASTGDGADAKRQRLAGPEIPKGGGTENVQAAVQR